MIDDHVGLADLGEGIAAPSQLDSERGLRLLHPGRVDRILGADRERVPKRRSVRPRRRLQPRQPHLGEAVERPRLDAQCHQEGGGALGVDRGGDAAVIIAVGAQQLAEQFGVGPGATVDLRRIGRIAAIFLERGEGPELGEQRRCVLVVQPFDAVGVGPRRRRVGDAGVGQVRNDVALVRLHVGPVDAQIGPVLERRRRIERLIDLVQRIRWLRMGSGRAENEGKRGREGRRAPPRNDLQHKAKLAGARSPRQSGNHVGSQCTVASSGSMVESSSIIRSICRQRQKWMTLPRLRLRSARAAASPAAWQPNRAIRSAASAASAGSVR